MEFTFETARTFARDLARWANLTGLWDAAQRIYAASDYARLVSFGELVGQGS